MFTAIADLILPCTTTGSFPRPRWFDVSMWGRPLGEAGSGGHRGGKLLSPERRRTAVKQLVSNMK
jgi:hypothetical protein